MSPGRSGAPIDDETVRAIRERARQLADAAPSLTNEQKTRLRALWLRVSADQRIPGNSTTVS